MTNADRQSKNQRREAAREKARELREAQRRKERRNRVFLQGGLIIAAVAVVAIVGLVIVNSIRPAGPGPANMASDGIKLTSTTSAEKTPGLAPQASPTASKPSGDAIPIVIFEDYFCPICNQFEQTNSQQIATWLDSGYVTYEIHPISFLDRSSLGTRYSSRSANAAACVAAESPDDYWAFNTAMYANQPQEGTSGLSNEQILGVIEKAGVKNMSAITSCVNNETYKNWVGDATARAQNFGYSGSDVRQVTGTPTIIVNGKQAPSTVITSAQAFAAFVVEQSGQQFNESASATPTPTPTP